MACVDGSLQVRMCRCKISVLVSICAHLILISLSEVAMCCAHQLPWPINGRHFLAIV